jgi:hypothetical protein
MPGRDRRRRRLRPVCRSWRTAGCRRPSRPCSPGSTTCRTDWPSAAHAASTSACSPSDRGRARGARRATAASRGRRAHGHALKLLSERLVWRVITATGPGDRARAPTSEPGTPTTGVSFVSGHVVLVTGLAWSRRRILRGPLEACRGSPSRSFALRACTSGRTTRSTSLGASDSAGDRRRSRTCSSAFPVATTSNAELGVRRSHP